MADAKVESNPQSMPATEKMDKKAVNYRTGDEQSSCATCRYFTQPSDCRLVQGPVAANMLCDLYTPTEEQRGQMMQNMFGPGGPSVPQ